MNRERSLRAAFMAALLTMTIGVCGCEKKSLGLPDDTPWNNGFYAIMETENGYYSNLMYTQNLRFYEKGTDTEIYLCGKPECPHDGRESCTATYRNLTTVNSALYDGAIYILATEEGEDFVSYDLYRAALDGSTMDKVGEVFKTEKLPDEVVDYEPVTATGEPTSFIIHRGYAYIPFYVYIPKMVSVFPGGGIMKMDLKTGQTEEIYKMKVSDFPYPWYLAGCGDYVYFYSYEKKQGYHRYDTRDGSVTYLSGEEPFTSETKHREIAAVAEDVIYVTEWSYAAEDGTVEADGWKILTYGSETLEEKGVAIEGDTTYGSFRLIPYEDKLFLCCEDEIVVYSKKGEKLGTVAYDFPGFISYAYPEEDENPLFYYHHEDNFILKISQGKVYAILRYYGYYSQENDCEVYACGIQDIMDGTGKWSHVYTVKNLKGLTGEYYGKAPRRGGHIYFEKGDASSTTVSAPVLW